MNWLEFWVNILLPILTILIPVFTTIYTVSRRVENENRETHRPYLVLRKITNIDALNIYEYHLALFGSNFLKKNKVLNYEEILKEVDDELKVELSLRNIGYGVATNIKFYDLMSAKEVFGTQTNNENQNQKLFTTFDIASNEEKHVQSKIISEKEQDNIKILCVYQDLNAHIYSFIFSINIKNNEHYDFFAYQPSSRSYKKWIRQSKKQYRSILKQYNRL